MAISLNRIIFVVVCILLIILFLVIIALIASAKSTGPYAYIPNTIDDTVSVINASTNNVTSIMPAGRIPGNIK